MGASVRVTPLYGARAASPAHALLLEVDGFVFLVDCGWDTRFDPALVDDALRPHLPRVDAVLLTHPTLHHLGALPRACASLGLRPNVPVYATLPVWRLGQMFLYDAYQSVNAVRAFDLFDLDDVDAAFEVRGSAPRFHLLKYQQHFPLDHAAAPNAGDPRARDVVITPLPAGHTLGGAIWLVRKGADAILIALDVNHRRENHLNPAALAGSSAAGAGSASASGAATPASGALSRPTHLLLGAANSPVRTRPIRTAHLVAPILETVRDGGNVLIPVDTAARIIELAVELNDAWAANRAMLARQHAPVPLVVLHEFAARTFDFARTMIEWMSDRVVKRFDNTRENLFNFRHLRTCHSREEVDTLPSPKVVLATSACLEMGFARDLFIDWAPSAKNLVLLVDRPVEGTLAATVRAHAVDGQVGDTPAEALKHVAARKSFSLPVTCRRKEKLTGEELRRWREEQLAAKRRKEQETKEDAEKIFKDSQALEEQKPGSAVAAMSVDLPNAGANAGVATEAPLGTTDISGTVDGVLSSVGLGPSTSNVKSAHGTPSTLAGDGASGVSGPTSSGAMQDRGQGQPGSAEVSKTFKSGSAKPAAAKGDGTEDDSSSEDDDDDDDYDTALVMGLSTASAAGGRRAGAAPLLGARPQAASLLGSGSGRSSGAALPIGIAASSQGESRVGGRLRPPESVAIPTGRGGVSMNQTGRAGMAAASNGSGNGSSFQRKASGSGGSWDDYGQSIGVNRFAIGEDPAASLRARSQGGAGTSYGDLQEGEEGSRRLGHGTLRERKEEDEVPTHYVVNEVTLTVSCRLVAVDRSGLSEGDALKYMVKELEPQRVILVTGTEAETQHLYDYLAGALSPMRSRDATNGGDMASKFCSLSGLDVSPRKRQKTENGVDVLSSVVSAPSTGDSIDVTSPVTMQELTLDDSVLGKVRWKKIGASAIGYVDGSLSCKESLSENPVVFACESTLVSGKRISRPSEGDGAKDPTSGGSLGTTGVLVKETAGGSDPDPMDAPIIPPAACGEFLNEPVGNPTVYVGTIMLSRLKDALHKAGIEAELAEGILCVQNHETGAVVLVKKVGLQNLVLEGALCEEYYAVRDVLYDELVVVSAV